MGGVNYKEIIMREINAREIMECWNLNHPDNPCTLKDVEDFLKYIAFFGNSPQIAVKYIEECGGFKSPQ